MSTWWDEQGFEREPRYLKLERPLCLYRVHGGVTVKFPPLSRPFVHFSTLCPESKQEAEALFSLWEWGNTCTYLTAVELHPDTGAYYGKPRGWTDSIPSLEDPRIGIQVSVPQDEKNPISSVVRELWTKALEGEMRGAVPVGWRGRSGISS